MASGKLVENKTTIVVPLELLMQNVSSDEKIVAAIISQFDFNDDEEMIRFLEAAMQKDRDDVVALIRRSKRRLLSDDDLARACACAHTPPFRGGVHARARTHTRAHARARGAAAMIEYWNGLGVRKHRDGTAVYDRAVNMINRVMSGTFWRDVQIRNDDQSLTDKPWTDHDLRMAMYHVSLLFRPERWPADKRRLPRNLPDLIYNPRTKYSFLLAFAADPPGLISGAVPKLCQQIVDEFGVVPPNSLSDYIDSLFSTVIERGGGLGSYLYPDLDSMRSRLLQFLSESRRRITFDDLKPGSRLLVSFEEEIFSEFS